MSVCTSELSDLSGFIVFILDTEEVATWVNQEEIDEYELMRQLSDVELEIEKTNS